MTKKKYIDVYKSMYPLELIVANKNVTLDDLKKKFVYSDGVELDDFVTRCAATTCMVKYKGKDTYGCLVKYNYPDPEAESKTMDLIDSASHEAMHVLLDTYDFISDTVCTKHQEPAAYYMGWITTNIYRTWTKK